MLKTFLLLAAFWPQPPIPAVVPGPTPAKPNPVVKPQPPAQMQAAYFVKVDRIVINRVRSFTTEYDAWGRPTYKSTEVWWISFWDDPRAVLLPIPGLEIDRGWWAMDTVVNISRCTEGWIAENQNGINVIAKQLIVIDSSFDWEMRNRRIYRPIKKP